MPAKLQEVHGLDTRDVSVIEQSGSVEDIKTLLGNALGVTVSDNDAKIAKWASKIVSDRASKLAATALAAGLVHMGLAQLGGGGPTHSEKILIAVGGE